MNRALDELRNELKGKLFYDETMRRLYATDASAYREMPLAVAIPEDESDIVALVKFAGQKGTSLIPRTAGTSLAGQVVGNGIVVDVSKHFTEILEVNQEENWVRLQPGVIRDDLNKYLMDFGLYFGPETSTANRAMLGGMVGNNSCGANSVVYGSTRDHLLEVRAVLSDGSVAHFGPLDKNEFLKKCEGDHLEASIYRQVKEMLSNDENRKSIKNGFPKPEIPRRNTGYAVDLLMDAEVFEESNKPFNFCKLIAGSEGTLAFITEIKIHVDPLPPSETVLVCAHFDNLYESLEATLVALEFNTQAVELMDHYVLERTKTNIEQRKNRFFVKGDPAAILVVDLSDYSLEKAEEKAKTLISAFQKKNMGYHYPIVEGADSKKVWTLRKAGLGLLSNIPGDAKPAPVIEDTAVDVRDLPAYIKDFNEILRKHDLYCVHYAHAGSGELHLRPILNLKTQEGTRLFRTIAEEIASLVKKYKGSLSGEHGDGRLRGEFIEFMVGEYNYQLLRQIKMIWDPGNVFNPNKIVDTSPMDTSLRYTPGQKTPQFDTAFSFEKEKGILRAAELCNGSGDCRKSHLSGGTMCPSYMATKDEKDTTRARANILREILTNSDKVNRFDSEAIKEVMDLCLSCKGCTAECPSNVDLAKLKAEFTYQYYKSHSVPMRTRMIANINSMNKLASIAPGAYNFLVKNKVTSKAFKKLTGFAEERSLPALHSISVNKWYRKNKQANFGFPLRPDAQKVYFFCDEFTNFNDAPIGITAIKLLAKLGYEVIIPNHSESGRAFISKGLLDQAKKLAMRNTDQLAGLKDGPIIGLEPSAILTLRDEYSDLVPREMKDKAEKLAENTFLIDEFLERELETGKIAKDIFTNDKKLIKLHGHCHQKALSSVVPTKKILSIPENYEVQMIPSGCCGMAGSFGYEKEHYKVSMKIGELVLFPTIRKQPDEVIIAAPGTSCRHQIADGTERKALHPVEILWQALIS